MTEQIEIFFLGLATVVDTVLLLVVLERVNRPRVPLWLSLLAFGTWLLHTASFLHVLILDSNASAINDWDRLCRCLMACALLLLPSTILHAAVRLNHSGIDARVARSIHYVWLYLPLLFAPWAIGTIATQRDDRFLENFNDYSNMYLGWMVTANLCSMLLMLHRRRTITEEPKRRVLLQLVVVLLSLTGLALAAAYLPRSSVWEPWLRALTAVSPSMAVSLFVWHTLRQRLMPLVFERTLIYGAFLVIVLLMHQQFVRPLTDALQRKANVDFVILEFIVLLSFVLAWKPLRNRFAEATRYLLSKDLVQVRERIRQLALQLSRHALLPPLDLRHWLERMIVQDLEVDTAKIWLTEEFIANVPDQQREALQLISHKLQNQQQRFIDQSLTSDVELCEAMVRLQAMWAFRLEFQSISGLALLGRRHRNDRLGEEALHALALLFEQVAATLHNRAVEHQRSRAERRLMQQEKLSVLGLLAGSLTHELRNPLSSIRTIATLLKEELPVDDPKHRDVSIIVSEIDRLTQTTQRFLDYAKPADDIHSSVEPDRVAARLLPILEQLARQYHVQLTADLQAPQCAVTGTAATLSEIWFNLIRNAIEAVRDVSSGSVWVRSQVCGDQVHLIVKDNGPGIDSSIRQTMFEPFVTCKTEGTGLGLYVVAERVRELEGKLTCHSTPSEGTEFLVQLPVTKTPTQH